LKLYIPKWERVVVFKGVRQDFLRIFFLGGGGRRKLLLIGRKP